MKVVFIVLVLTLICSACSFHDPRSKPEFNNAIFDFLDAVAQQRSEVAFSLLAADVQRQIGRDSFNQAIATADFAPLVNSFRKAGIQTRQPGPHQELKVQVAKLHGKEGDVIFVMVESQYRWKIANLVEV